MVTNLLTTLVSFPAIPGGMPVPLPYDTKLVEALTEPTTRQIKLMIAAAVGVLIVSKLIQAVWNSLAADFTKLPRLNYLKALGATLLWGLAMFLVLIMIAGSREALTPQAWVRNGWTYKLSDEQSKDVTSYRKQRRENLHELYDRLKAYADERDGRWPETLDGTVPRKLSQVPGTGGLKYVYRPDDDAGVLAIEPDFDRVRLALSTDGTISER